jgi:phosphatidate cytidylyltransferase
VKNLLRRTLVALLGVPLLLFLVAHPPWYLGALIVVVQAICLWEWSKLCQLRNASVNVPGLAIAVAGVDALMLVPDSKIAVAICIASLALLFLVEVFRRAHAPLLNLGGAMLFFGLVALPLALWNRLHLTLAAASFAPFGVLPTLFVVTWICDTAAYFVGRAIGKHKLYTAASPHKTVEGFIAGVIGAALVLPALSTVNAVQPRPLDYAVFPVIVGIFGQLGDLLESLIKREVGVKDTSTILPGHGGLLDRFDSLLLSTPFLFAYLSLGAF